MVISFLDFISLVSIFTSPPLTLSRLCSVMLVTYNTTHSLDFTIHLAPALLVVLHQELHLHEFRLKRQHISSQLIRTLLIQLDSRSSAMSLCCEPTIIVKVNMAHLRHALQLIESNDQLIYILVRSLAHIRQCRHFIDDLLLHFMLLDDLILDLVKLLEYELFELLLFVVQGDQLLSFSLVDRYSFIEIIIL